MSSRWPKVTRAHPCPKCGKPDQCKIARDGRAGHCFREGRTWRDGGGNERESGYVGAVHRPRPQAHAPEPSERDWHSEAERLRGAMTDDRLSALAEATGVPAAAWASLSPGWASADDLRAMRASGACWKDSPPDGAWVFVEHDGDGRIVGLSLRQWTVGKVHHWARNAG